MGRRGDRGDIVGCHGNGMGIGRTEPRLREPHGSMSHTTTLEVTKQRHWSYIRGTLLIACIHRKKDEMAPPEVRWSTGERWHAYVVVCLPVA
jgi:hypothetical protein